MHMDHSQHRKHKSAVDLQGCCVCWVLCLHTYFIIAVVKLNNSEFCQIMVKKLSLSLANSLESCCDYIRVFDGPTSLYPLLGELRGNRIQYFNTTQNDMTVVFYSDHSVTSKGFRANWVFVGMWLKVWLDLKYRYTSVFSANYTMVLQQGLAVPPKIKNLSKDILKNVRQQTVLGHF